MMNTRETKKFLIVSNTLLIKQPPTHSQDLDTCVTLLFMYHSFRASLLPYRVDGAEQQLPVSLNSASIVVKSLLHFQSNFHLLSKMSIVSATPRFANIKNQQEVSGREAIHR